MLRQTQLSLHRHRSPGKINGQSFGRCFGRPQTCVRQQRTGLGPSSSASFYSPAAVSGNTVGAPHLRLSSGLRQRQDATTGLAAQARSGHSGDADSIHLYGVVVDSDAFDAAFPGLLTGAAGAELVVNTPSSDHSSATGQGVPLVPHDCTIINTSPQLRQHPGIAICAASSLGEALALEPGSILDLQLSGGEVVAEVAGWLRAPPPPADTVTLARVVVLGDLYLSPEVNMTTSHFKWSTPIRIRLEIMNQLLGSQARSKVVPGSSYDVYSAVPPVQSLAAAAAGAGAVVATLNFHLNESKGTSYWRLLDGIHSWAEGLGGVGGDALRLAHAVGGIPEVPAGGKDTLVKTLITARLVKRTTAGGVVAAAAADTAPPEAAVEPPPPPAAATGVAPAPSSIPAAVAPGSIARPRRAPQRGKGKAKHAQQDAAAASDLQQLNRTAELILAAVERMEVLLRERQQ